MIDISLDWPASGRDCFEFRVGIEGEAAAAAARERTAGDLALMTGRVDCLENLDPMVDDGVDADFAFHLAVTRASHNDYYVSALISLRQSILDGMLLARTTSGLDTPRKIAAINAQHRLIYESIIDGDADAARDAMRMHLIRCRNATLHWDDNGFP